MRLDPANSEMQPIVVDPNSESRILGVLVGVLRQVLIRLAATRRGRSGPALPSGSPLNDSREEPIVRTTASCKSCRFPGL